MPGNVGAGESATADLQIAVLTESEMRMGTTWPFGACDLGGRGHGSSFGCWLAGAATAWWLGIFNGAGWGKA